MYLREQDARCGEGEAVSNLSPLAHHFESLAENGWSARAVKRCAADLVSLRHSLHTEERVAWLAGLRRCVAQHGWALDTATLDHLLTLAFDWCDWQLTLHLGGMLEPHGALRAGQSAMVANTLAKMGASSDAMDRCRRAMFIDPFDRDAEAIYRQLSQSDQPVVAEDEELRLVKLSACHCADFAWQYFDEEMVDLCNLPVFHDADQWLQWQRENEAEKDQITLAVLHREWGFIGVVDLYMPKDVGYFYYWIGRDFRGNGLGPRAAQLLLETAEQCWGMRACFANVYEENHASRSGLAKLGFREVDLKAQEATRRKLVYYRGDDEPSVMQEDAEVLFAQEREM